MKKKPVPSKRRTRSNNPNNEFSDDTEFQSDDSMGEHGKVIQVHSSKGTRIRTQGRTIFVYSEKWYKN